MRAKHSNGIDHTERATDRRLLLLASMAATDFFFGSSTSTMALFSASTNAVYVTSVIFPSRLGQTSGR
jgi:hypothetical protein